MHTFYTSVPWKKISELLKFERIRQDGQYYSLGGSKKMGLHILSYDLFPIMQGIKVCATVRRRDRERDDIPLCSQMQWSIYKVGNVKKY